MSKRRFEISGNPTPVEEKAILKALDEFLQRELQSRKPSIWKAVGRAEATRGGALDFRNRLASRAWHSPKLLPWTGKRYDGRHGRGDAR